MQEVSHKELEYMIGRFYEIRKKKSLYIWGATGIGKSVTVKRKAEEIAKSLNREFVEWNKLSIEKKLDVEEHPEKYFFLMDQRLSQIDPSDLRGLPGLNGKKFTEWRPTYWHYVASKPKSAGIIFLDEINLAPPSIQAAAYQLINDRELGETPIADGVGTVAAGNRLEDRANVYELPRPLQNRFSHVLLTPPLIDVTGKHEDKDWVTWAMNNNVDSRIITFLHKNPHRLNADMKKETGEKAFATPRSWAYCSDLIEEVNDLGLIDILAGSTIGVGIAKEFTSHIKFRNQLNLQDILKTPKKVAEIKELDITYSLISLASEWYGQNIKVETLEKICEIVQFMDVEFGMLLLRFCRAKNSDKFRDNLLKSKGMETVRKKYGKFLLAI